MLELARRCMAGAPDAKAEALLDWMYRLQQEESDPALKFLVFTEFVWFGLEIEINCFTNILKGLCFGSALRPTALERRNVSDKITVLAGLDDDLDVHCT